MKSHMTKSSELNITGSGRSDQEIFSTVLKHWGQKVGYCSVVAAVPALLASNLPVAHSAEAKKPQIQVIGNGTRNLAQLNLNAGNRGLLKRQSQFRLPHQSGDDRLTPLSGLDDCPGRIIPGGNYTVGAPYIDAGDTTGANDTVTSVPSYYYYFYYGNYHAHGPDHVYTFTLTAHGPDARIEVSATNGSYKPLIYVIEGGSNGEGCPAGTNNDEKRSPWIINDSRWDTSSNKATVPIDFLPLNVPLHLFVDSAENDSSGAGPYTVRMQDVTVAPQANPNQIDGTEFFVRQQYRDFLNRDADSDGLAFWMNQITSCGGDQGCIEAKRINDSGAFFLSNEFQETGYLAYRTYLTAFGRLPNAPVPITFNEFIPDTQALGSNVIVNRPGWENVLENNKQAFLSGFVQRARFTDAFTPAMSAQEFVDKLNGNAGNPLSQTERDQLVSDLSGGQRSRAEVLRAIAENPKLVQAEFNRAFVLMQYFGYLRRNPSDAPDNTFVGYNFWLDKLNSFNGDFNQAEMVKAFISSPEYLHRFGS
jgi:hypothetical protein